MDGHQVHLRAGVRCVTRRDTGTAEFVQPSLRKDKGDLIALFSSVTCLEKRKYSLWRLVPKGPEAAIGKV